MDAQQKINMLVNELGRAEIIIHAMLNIMTLEQKKIITKRLLFSGTSPDEMTRVVERRAVLEKFGA